VRIPNTELAELSRLPDISFGADDRGFGRDAVFPSGSLILHDVPLGHCPAIADPAFPGSDSQIVEVGDTSMFNVVTPAQWQQADGAGSC
jgi:hypothetical protein